MSVGKNGNLAPPAKLNGMLAARDALFPLTEERRVVDVRSENLG